MAIATTAAVVMPEDGCTEELTEMSPCLPYISSPQSNLSSSPSNSCCVQFNWAFDTGRVTCLCHLIHQPFLMGFHVSVTRILSLSSICPRTDAAKFPSRISLKDFCEGT
ncbi:Bifunctional inhibitor/plant lipid transfer protein/seed storage helical domain [Macleaya cordata]|uniref:Bifunctional inhibitor/plant lipid transfer protein/seed storage helical domain n=1 Tax=Macleaya cordata TaxID=56857 RepID=A0A200RAP2_MACCD|nr:Bifunctional inhibitor/plant lipid transfer protein/seed storage helical domain [Macleaya cordata]